jgi:hypothetical protein
MSQRTAASHAASCLLQILTGMNAEVQAVLLISIAELLIPESRANRNSSAHAVRSPTHRMFNSNRHGKLALEASCGSMLHHR